MNREEKEEIKNYWSHVKYNYDVNCFLPYTEDNAPAYIKVKLLETDSKHLLYLVTVRTAYEELGIFKYTSNLWNEKKVQFTMFEVMKYFKQFNETPCGIRI